MGKKIIRHWYLIVILVPLFFFGCGQGTDDDTINLDYDKGEADLGDYYNSENEAPGFGDKEILAMTEDTPYDDPFDNLTKTAGTGDVFYIRVLWGNLIVDWDDPNPARDYSGSITIDDGLLVIERTVRFENHDSEIDTRYDERIVSWQSRILPHYDGLVLRLEPGDTPDDENILHFIIGAYELDLTVAELMDVVMMEETELYNDHVALASHLTTGLGSSGFLSGHWRNLPEVEGGIFKGKWENGSGTLMGHERCRYIPNGDGTGIIKGKYIDTDGDFKGKLYGQYTNVVDAVEKGVFDLDVLEADNTQIGQANGIYLSEENAHYGFALGNWITF